MHVAILASCVLLYMFQTQILVWTKEEVESIYGHASVRHVIVGRKHKKKQLNTRTATPYGQEQGSMFIYISSFYANVFQHTYMGDY